MAAEVLRLVSVIFKQMIYHISYLPHVRNDGGLRGRRHFKASQIF